MEGNRKRNRDFFCLFIL